jgi:hypothetical protein
MAEYEVGYGKPPKKKRFKKGQSGNAAGRPKGSKNFLTVLGKALNEQVIVTERGRQRSISKLEAMVTQLVNRAAGGDLTAIQRVGQLALMLEDKKVGDSNSGVIDPRTDQELLRTLTQRLTRSENAE